MSHSKSDCDTVIEHIIQLGKILCTTYRSPDAPNHMSLFEDNRARMEDVLRIGD